MIRKSPLQFARSLSRSRKHVLHARSYFLGPVDVSSSGSTTNFKALIFPGQGSQYVGMGKDLVDPNMMASQNCELKLGRSIASAARLVFEEANDTLNQNLSKLMFEGPEEELTLTKNAQPAILVHSMAIWSIIKSELGLSFDSQFNDFFVSRVLGHSLGEYSALVCNESLSLADAVKLVRTRGNYMMETEKGEMAALMPITEEIAFEVCREACEETNEIVDVANINAPSQIVISGTPNAVERAITIASKRGVKRAVKLKVSNAFHSRLMEPAALQFAKHLNGVKWGKATYQQQQQQLRQQRQQHQQQPKQQQQQQQPLQLPLLISNVTAREVLYAEELPSLLEKQVTSPVLWSASVLRCVATGCSKQLPSAQQVAEGGGSGISASEEQQDEIEFIELGPNNHLSSLVKRITPNSKTRSIGDVNGLLSFLRECIK